MRRLVLSVGLLFLLFSALAAQSAKPKLTLDEFFNSVDFPEVQVSPDGNSIVIETAKADWEQQIFRKELWLYRTGAKPGGLMPLTQSGHDSAASMVARFAVDRVSLGAKSPRGYGKNGWQAWRSNDVRQRRR